MRNLLIGIIVIGLVVGVVAAQEDAPEVIDAWNVARLGSVARLDDADVDNDMLFDDEDGEIVAISGIFALSYDGQVIGYFGQQGNIYLVDIQGNYLGDSSPTDEFGFSLGLLDWRFVNQSYDLLILHPDAAITYVLAGGISGSDPPFVNPPPFSELYPSDNRTQVWQNGKQIFIGMLPSNPDNAPYTLSFHIEGVSLEDPGQVRNDLSKSIQIIPSPDADPESVIRIGRIEPPLAVTVTEDGRVKRWNMETGEVTAEVQIDVADGLPIYGAVNAGGDEYLVWRDPASTALHVLNFEAGEDARIVELGGSYMPFIFLSSAADVIIGVNVDDAPVVVAWDVATGTRYDLGEYRECNRPPDMARLSQDGTTLVIGCDTGLDIWRVR